MDDPPLARWAWTEAVTAARQRSDPHNPCTKSRLGMELPSSVVAQGAEEGTLHHLNRRTGAAAWMDTLEREAHHKGGSRSGRLIALAWLTRPVNSRYQARPAPVRYLLTVHHKVLDNGTRID